MNLEAILALSRRRLHGTWVLLLLQLVQMQLPPKMMPPIQVTLMQLPLPTPPLPLTRLMHRAKVLSPALTQQPLLKPPPSLPAA